MSCPTCGNAATCPRCAKGSSGSWGSAFDSWGSSSGEWGAASGESGGADSPQGWGGLAVASRPAASSWVNPSTPAPPTQATLTDGWGSPAPSSPAQAPSSPLRHQPAVDEADGWGSPLASPAVPPSPRPALEADGWSGPLAPKEHAQLPALDDPFLDEEGGRDDSPLQPVRQQWSEDEEEGWIDEAVDEEELAPLASPAGSGQGLLWAAVAITGLTLFGGLMFLRQPRVAAPDPATIKIEQRMEALHSGRRLIIAGKATMSGDKAKRIPGDPEGATLQLEAAIKSLKEGSANSREIGRARSLLAQCWWTARHWEQAYAAWDELGAIPAYKSEADRGKAKAKDKLLASADTQLQNSTGSLRAEQYAQSVSQANEALRLLETYKGPASKKGTAHGNIAFAELNLGHRSAALSHFNQAYALSGNTLYANMAADLQPGGVPAAEPAAPAPSSPKVVDASAGVDPRYPTGKPGSPTSRPKKPAATPKTPKPSVAVQKPAVTAPKFVPTPKPTKRPRPNDQFDMTDHSKK